MLEKFLGRRKTKHVLLLIMLLEFLSVGSMAQASICTRAMAKLFMKPSNTWNDFRDGQDLVGRDVRVRIINSDSKRWESQSATDSIFVWINNIVRNGLIETVRIKSRRVFFFDGLTQKLVTGFEGYDIIEGKVIAQSEDIMILADNNDGDTTYKFIGPQLGETARISSHHVMSGRLSNWSWYASPTDSIYLQTLGTTKSSAAKVATDLQEFQRKWPELLRRL